jgi:long-chain acyl-CoA synthetase
MLSLTLDQERISAADLCEQADRLAHGLASRGVGAGDPVAVILPNGLASAASILALMRLGAVATPLSPQCKPAELAFVFRDAGVKAAVTDDRGAALCRGLDVRVLTALDAMADEPPLAPRDRAGDAIYQYSSGSTGRPKRVPRTHAQLAAEAEAYVRATGLGADDTILCALPLFHTYGLGCCLMAAVHSGATLVILDGPAPFAIHRGRALDLLERHGVTVFPAVPFMLRLLADGERRADLSALRFCFSAANALPRSTFEAFDRRFGVPVRQLYGLTEAGAVTVNADGDPWATARSVGRPLPGVELEVRDAGGRPAESGRIGEIAIRGPAMTRGYGGVDEEVNRQAFPGGWFLTGDRGRLDEDRRLIITGRRKLLIDVRGDKVDPIEVEDVLAVHPKVREVVVVGAPSGVDGEERVKAVVVARDPCGERELIRFCRERLANHKLPELVEFRDEIPRSPLGKVLRKDLV